MEGLCSSLVTFATCSSGCINPVWCSSDSVFFIVCFLQKGPQGFTGPPGEPGEAGSAVSILHLQDNNTKQKEYTS